MTKIDKVPTLEELNELLKCYELKIDENYLKYLKGIINLEFSALRKDVIDDEERKDLSKLFIYRKACIYNIYTRTMDILKKEKEDIDITIKNNNNNYQGIIVQGSIDNNKKFSVYNYDYSNEQQTIDLYEYLFSYAQREKEANSILEELEFLYDEENPYISDNKEHTKWEYNHQNKIKNLEYQYKLLEQRTNMPDKELYIAETKNHFARLLETEYGIYPKKDYIDESKKTFYLNRKNHLVKTLRRDYPTLTLKKEVKYY